MGQVVSPNSHAHARNTHYAQSKQYRIILLQVPLNIKTITRRWSIQKSTNLLFFLYDDGNVYIQSDKNDHIEYLGIMLISLHETFNR